MPSQSFASKRQGPTPVSWTVTVPDAIHVPVVRIGWPDEFVEHGSVDLLRAKHGVTAEAAVERILALLEVGTSASAKAGPSSSVKPVALG